MKERETGAETAAEPFGEEKTGTSAKTPSHIIGIVLCVLLIPVLLLNCCLIIKGMIYPSEVPSIAGYCPLIVLTESMEPEIKSGDLIICKNVKDASNLKVGETISFFDPAGNGSTVVTHKIIRIETDEKTGAVAYRTQGVNNNIEDRLPVPSENVIGVYSGVRFAFIGRVIIFAQSPVGLILCIAVPFAAFAAAWYIERRRQDRKRQREIEELKARAKDAESQSRIDALEAELEALRASSAGKAEDEKKDNGTE